MNDIESLTNFNQSFNDNIQYREYENEIKKSWINTLKNISKFILICLIIFPMLFILIGIIYKNSCFIKPNIPLYLIIFGILILINLFIYTIIGTTFLTLIRHTRLFSLEKGIEVFIGMLFGIIFGIIIFIWWITGTIWWIKLTLSIKSYLKYPNLLNSCHPVVYWTALVANIFGLIGFIVQICIAIADDMTASKQSSKVRG